MKNKFVAIDFETATRHHICAVGIVTVQDGEIIDEYHTLIKPPKNEYNWHNIQVHGISENDTKNSKRFNEMFPEIEKRISNKLVIAHNESFDRNTLIKTMNDYHIDYSELNISEKWECTMKIYRKKGYKPASLDACCKHENIELNHHEALSDARACAKLYLKA